MDATFPAHRISNNADRNHRGRMVEIFYSNYENKMEAHIKTTVAIRFPVIDVRLDQNKSGIYIKQVLNFEATILIRQYFLSAHVKFNRGYQMDKMSSSLCRNASTSTIMKSSFITTCHSNIS